MPGSGSNPRLGTSLRVFQTETSVWVGGRIKADYCTWRGGPVPSLKAQGEHRAEWRRICSFCLVVFELGYWSSFSFGLGLGWKLHPRLFRVASLPAADLGVPQPPLMCELICMSHLPTSLASRYRYVCMYYLSKYRNACVCML